MGRLGEEASFFSHGFQRVPPHVNKENSFLLPHKISERKQGVNKNRSELSALTSEVLNGSGPSVSGRSSFAMESHRQASGLSVFATLTPQQRAVASLLRQETRG